MPNEDQLDPVADETIDSTDPRARVDQVTNPVGATLEPGAIVDRYRLISKLGEGGFGVVYLASHKSFPNRRYALKLVRPDRIATKEFSDRFAKEIQAMGDLDHPNVVYATDAGEWNGIQYLAMDYVDGVGLNQLVSESQISISDACEVVRQASVGMQHVHEKGRTHRDLKPSNLMLDRAGVVRILDLGIAKLRGDSESEAEPLTAMGQMMGTPDYMAPEQWEDSSTVDIRADIYSLGCTLFCLLAGRPPFGDGEHRSTVAKMKAHTTKTPPDVASLRAEVPSELAAVVSRCLQRARGDRYQTPLEVADALVPFSTSANVSAMVAASRGVPLVDQTDVSTGIEAHLDSTVVKKNPPASSARTSKLQMGLQVPGCMISIQIGMAVMLVAGLSVWFSDGGTQTGDGYTSTGTSSEAGPENVGHAEQQGEFPKLAQTETVSTSVETRAFPRTQSAIEQSVLQIEHFRADSDDIPERVGRIGVHDQRILLNDVVRLAVELKSEQHVLVVAFNPDGSVQLCVPGDEDTVTTAARKLEFPSESDVYFRLSDGKGQQAFLVLTSDEQMPAFAELRPDFESIGWSTSRTGGLWQFTGNQVSQLFPGRKERGSIERLTSKSFRELCLAVKEKFPAWDVTGFAFPVE